MEAQNLKQSGGLVIWYGSCISDLIKQTMSTPQTVSLDGWIIGFPPMCKYIWSQFLHVLFLIIFLFDNPSLLFNLVLILLHKINYDDHNGVLILCGICRSLQSDFTSMNNRGWMRTFSGDRERPGRERKGWMITIHDLSGSPVAAASMITPFVPSPGSDRVSRSNPGAWLILRPHGFSVSSWKPWGRLEAWRERGPIDGLGYKFELVTDNGPSSSITIAEGTMSVKKGGQFCIDSSLMRDSALNSRSPVKGFVTGSTVEGEGKVSKPSVQVGVQHVTCMADAALFVALSAAIDLSMDACRLFSHKLRKELCHDEQNCFS